MSIPKLVAANIVTGFLGSGKTTLLKSALKEGLDGLKVALIVNEFGDIDIDGVVLQHGINVDRMVQLPSGCVCCTIGSRFALAVQEIVDSVQPHMIIIETSGVAEPGPLVSELSLIGVRTDSVITVVDAENIARFCKENESAVRQIEEADFVVINKTDLVSSKELVRVKRLLNKLNDRALLVTSYYGQVAEDILFTSSVVRHLRRSAQKIEHDGHEKHLEGGGITAFSFQREGVLSRDRFEQVLEKLPAQVYRAKGIVKFSGEGWSSVFNYTCGRWRVEWLAPVAGTAFNNRAVVIGKDLAKVQERILQKLEGTLVEEQLAVAVARNG
ncbi:MAG: CobW family GTP-binding protein [Gammaproteobacteria bacterium]